MRLSLYSHSSGSNIVHDEDPGNLEKKLVCAPLRALAALPPSHLVLSRSGAHAQAGFNFLSSGAAAMAAVSFGGNPAHATLAVMGAHMVRLLSQQFKLGSKAF